MRFLVVAALMAVASADVRDATFQFRSLNGAPQVGQNVNLDNLVIRRTEQLEQLQKVDAQPQFIQRFQPQQQIIQVQAQPQVIQRVVTKPQVISQPQIIQRVVAQPQIIQRVQPALSFEKLPFEPAIRILNYQQEADPIGNYRFAFQTQNGIDVKEEGKVTNPGTQNESTAKQGSFSYPGDDGQQYTVTWVADDDGFRAEGDHLPTPPPVPEAILRSLELNERSGEQYDDNGARIN